MADLYGAPASPTSGHEHGELSTFLSQFIHNSSSSSSCFSFTNKNIHSFSSPPTEVNSDFGLLSQPEDGHRENLSGIDSSSGGFNFSSFVSTCVGGVDSDANDSEKDPEAAEVPASSTDRPRTSSKRSRAAEIHNLSEKRRRSRINEKMKALQNLIPNSNKTDKASMLDEAIEYLKQLQLQVQMLTMRNGLSLHPMWLPGVLQPVQLPQAGMIFDEGNGLPNTSRGTETFSVNEEGSVRNSFNISHECTLPNQPIAIPAANIGLPETRFGHEPLLHDHFTPFNSSSGKEICNDDTPHLHLDMNFIGKNPSTGMS